MNSRSFTSRELRGVDRANLKVNFQALHGLTEAVFRRSLLVGLRMHQVQFKDAENWLHDHDETPDRKEFPKRFDRLYRDRGITWAEVTDKSEPFRCALDSWHDYSNVIRNHLAHLEGGTPINRTFGLELFKVTVKNLSRSIERLEQELEAVFADDPCSLNHL